MSIEIKMYRLFINVLRDELISGYLDQGYTDEEAEEKAMEWLSPEYEELRRRFGNDKVRSGESAVYEDIKIQGRRLRIRKDKQ